MDIWDYIHTLVTELSAAINIVVHISFQINDFVFGRYVWEVELLDQIKVAFCFFRNLHISLSGLETVQDVPRSTQCECYFNHIPTNTSYLQPFYVVLTGVGDISLMFWIAFPWRMMNTFISFLAISSWKFVLIFSSHIFFFDGVIGFFVLSFVSALYILNISPLFDVLCA